MKRMMTLILSASLMASLMSGCTKTKETTTVDNDKTSTNPEVAQQELYTETGAYPITNEKIEMEFMTLNIPMIEDLESNEFITYMEEKTNIHINWQLAPQDKKEEKLNLVLASGDYPDVFFGMGITPNLEAQYGVDQQIFRPLDDLINKYAPNFNNNLLDKYKSVKGGITSIDGQIYALPTWNDCYHCNYALKYWINHDWLNKLGLKKPTTTEEFYQVLKAFKEQDPNGNGLADEIPLSGSNTWHGFLEPFIMNAFILDPDDDDKELRTIVRNGKVMTITNTEEYREGLRYIKRLYDEGLIGEGSFTQKADQLKQIATNPDAELVGTIPGGFAGLIIDSTAMPDRYRHYSALSPLEGPSGLRQTTKFNSALQTGNFLISATNKYPEAAMRWADFLYTSEGQLRRSGMREGIDYVVAKDGEVGINGLQAKIKRLTPYSQEVQNFGLSWLGIEYLPEEDRLGEVINQDVDRYTPEGFEMMLYERSAEQYAPYVSDIEKRLPPTRLSVEENDQIQIIKVELKKYMKESRLKFLLGGWDLDKNWDQYVKGLENLGINEYYEVLQKAYDRQYK